VTTAVGASGATLPRGGAAAGWCRHAALTACALIMAASVLAARAVHDRIVMPAGLPWVASVDVYHLFVDDRPIRVSITAGWERLPHTTTAQALRGDLALWRRMFTQDWDTVPMPVRQQGLDAMLRRYAPVLATPATWDAMTAHDWDLVPHPVRALAFRHMTQYWTGYYHVGLRHGLSPARVADTATAVIMSESWFDHRAMHVNEWGNRDLGLGQASDHARRRMAAWYEAGVVDVLLSDEDYFNPWEATRFVAIWLSSLLDETRGDLDLAVGAYHRGVRRASDAAGVAYADAVRRRLERYVRGDGSSPSWRYLLARDREITRVTWPWLRTRRVLGAGQRPATMAIDRPDGRTPTWWGFALSSAPHLP
jgi:hypothetical protein